MQLSTGSTEASSHDVSNSVLTMSSTLRQSCCFSHFKISDTGMYLTDSGVLKL